MNVLEQNAFMELFGSASSQGIPQGPPNADSARSRIVVETDERSERPQRLLDGWRRAHLASGDDGIWNADTLASLLYGRKQHVSFPIAYPLEETEFAASNLIESIPGSRQKHLRNRIRVEPPTGMVFGSWPQLVNMTAIQEAYDVDSWAALVWSNSIGPADSADPAHPDERSNSLVRPTGPVQFIAKLLTTWNLDTEHATVLLGLEDPERAHRMLSGHEPLVGRDVKDRIAHLYHIRRTLWSLFQDEEVENEWLREPHSLIYGKAPIDLLLEGSMENLLMFREYVESLARR